MLQSPWFWRRTLGWCCIVVVQMKPMLCHDGALTVMMNDSSFSVFAENRLEVLYAPIRYKMALALNNWHPSDSSAHKILEPWVKVSMGDLNTCGVMLATGNFGCLMVKHMVCLPSMAGFLSTKHGNVSGAYNSSKVGLLSSNGASCQPTKARNWLVDQLEKQAPWKYIIATIEGCTN